MRIMHYSLGFPPYRTGGLTKFCMDLMKEQVNEGHEVSLLWPGEIKQLNKGIKIKERPMVDGIRNLEIINPLPVSLDEGIKDCSAFMEEGNIDVYRKFLSHLRPDVIHIHTFMGLHKSLLEAAKSMDIRLVFTTHDYFPICPKVNMFRHGGICKSIESCADCGACNSTALSLTKIGILQSRFYRIIKDAQFIKTIRKKHRRRFLDDKGEIDYKQFVGIADNYKQLRQHYISMLNLIDIIHCNSNVAKKVYQQYLSIKDSIIRVISITHGDINDNRKRKEFSDREMKIRYLGPGGGAKGFTLLKESLDKLWIERQDFRLDIHFIPDNPSDYMITHERYNYSALEQIFNETDVLVSPSLWYETFGYTVLEALSYGVPVIVSSTVGAKDIITKGAGIIIDDINLTKLYNTISSLNTGKLKSMNEEIILHQNIPTVKELSLSVMEKLYSVSNIDEEK